MWNISQGNANSSFSKEVWRGEIQMKKKIAILAILLCVASTSTAFARGNHGYHGGGYHGRSYYNGHHHYSRHHNDGLGIAVGVVGGLILGSALAQSATPPQTVVYGSPYTTYQPEVVVQQPRVCVEDRRITGEWQISQFDGRQVWVSFPYPVIRRVQVPCY
jgi:hypothetical protein